MKYLLLLIGCLPSLTVLIAQDSNEQKPGKPRFFVSLALGYANKGALVGGAANVLFPSQFGIYLRGFTNQYKSKQLPVDYIPRTSFFGNHPITPQDITNVYSIGAIKEITIKKSTSLYKAGLELGPCLLFNKEVQFTRSYNLGGWFGTPTNYNTTFTKTNLFGLLLRPKLKMVDIQNWGVELASSIVITKSSPFYDIEMNITSGSIRLNKKKKANKTM